MINRCHFLFLCRKFRPQEGITSQMDVVIPPNNVTEFVLLGLTQNPLLQKILFIVFLFIFLVTVLANLLIVITISLSPTLSAPMYFFLTYLALRDVFYTSVTTLKLITDLLYQRRTISLGVCFVEHFLGGSEISYSSASWHMTARRPSASLCTT